MEKNDWLAEHFDEARSHLVAVAHRMLGSHGEAEDAVQEAWIRLNRSEPEAIDNPGGWLTTVVARICLDRLRSRKLRNEISLDNSIDEIAHEGAGNPEADYALADSIGPVLLVVLDLLSPDERIAFVLHDVFDLSFKDVAAIIDCSEESARQLASRARRRVRSAGPFDADRERQQKMVSAFLAASRDGNFEELISLLHPDVILRADDTTIKVTQANKSKGAPQFSREMTGAQLVAATFKGQAAAAQLALVNGSFGATWTAGGKPVVVFCFAITDERIRAIDIVMDKKALQEFDVEVIENQIGAQS